MIRPPIGLWLHRYQQMWGVLKIFLILIFVLFAAIRFYGLFKMLSSDNMWFNDFFFLWSYGKFVINKQVIEIYNYSTLYQFQMDLGFDPMRWAPYAYPPSFLLFILPLGFMSFYMAYATWVISSFAVYVIASLYKQGRPRYAPFIIIFAPATVFGIFTGQTGLLLSALIVGGFRLVTNRPILSGAVLGLASFKPQFGLLIPIALVSARQWRTLVSAGVTVLALVLASSVSFGWSLWPIWLSKISAHAELVAGIQDRFQPTILANLASLGVKDAVKWTIQASVAALVAIITWVIFRQGVTVSATAALLVGTFLATPYAVAYDMPMLTNAVLAVPRQRDQAIRFSTITETLTRVLLLVLPIMMISYRLSVIRSLPLIMLFSMIVWRHFRVRDDN